MPTFSILMAVQNEALYIDESIQSILDQSEPDWELLVVDDGSADATLERAGKYTNDPRIRVFSPGKIGKNAAFNMAFENASKDWVAFFAGDDRMCGDSLKDRCDPFRNRNPKIERLAVLSKLRTLSENRRFHGKVIPRGANTGNPSGGAILMSRALAEASFPLPESLPNEDTWTSLCILHFADEVKVAPVVTYHYRIHDGNSVRRSDPFEVATQKLHQRHAVYDHFREKHGRMLGESALREIDAHLRGEELRFGGRILRLAGVPGLSFATRLSLIMNSRPTLYAIRMRLWSLLSGWR